MKKISYIVILSALILNAANAQVRQPHQLYFMNGIPQIVQMNPALQPKANVYVFFPVINFNVDLFTDLAIKDIFQPQGNNLYTPFQQEYDYRKLRRSIGRNATMVNLGADWDILGFGFRTRKNNYFSFGLSLHGFGNVAMPSDFFKITENLFPANSTFDFSPLRGRGMVYTQFLFGYSRIINDRLTVGVNVKPLIGLTAFSTRINKFELRTGLDEWTLTADGKFFLSAPLEVVKERDNDDNYTYNLVDRLDGLSNTDIVRKYSKFNNPGIAFDFGATYKIDERLTVSASLNNLGFISWNRDLSGITFPGGSFAFEGLEVDASQESSTDDQIRDQLDKLLDDILDGLDGEIHNDKFSTFLPTVFHAAASYQLTRRSTVGLLSRTVFWQGSVRQSFNLSYYTPVIGNFLLFNTGLTYQINSTVYANLGLIFNFGPLQFYTLVDYIPFQWSRISIDGDPLLPNFLGFDNFPLPAHGKSLALRFGLNFTFGRHGFRNNPMLDRGNSSWN